ncbi:MAG: hypothetical protein IKD71_00875 [Solobacterium sp.]|nr:hypothetical protein [Solobacterium sp.]
MKCPSCGGTLHFDIGRQCLVCVNCANTYDADEYSVENGADASSWGEARMYRCRSCGAELLSMNDEAVSYCMYCGSEAVLEEEISGMNEPKRIIPFRIDRKECRLIYRKALEKKWYIPSEFKEEEFIERFRPFYIPYWMYSVKFREDPFTVKGYRDYTRGGYDYHEEYDILTEIKQKGLYGVPYDASRNFDDLIAEDIAPFRKKDLIPFRSGYLAGMYADRPNVSPELYRKEVMDKAEEEALSDIRKGLNMTSLKLPSGKKLSKLLDARYDGAEAVYLPVWFLTWRKGDRVAYAVVNGQTGKIHIDLPTDQRVFLRNTVLAAILLFVLLSRFVSVTSRFVLWFSALLVYLAGRRYRKELKEIRDRENHVFDKGYLLSDEDELSMSEKARSRTRMLSSIPLFRTIAGALTTIVISFAVLFGLAGLVSDELMTYEGAQALTLLILIAETVLFVRSVLIARHLRRKRSILVMILALAAVVYSFVVAWQEPVYDWWYYAGSLVCLAAASIMCLDLIARYNETATRPLPSFYVREGGNDHA